MGHSNACGTSSASLFDFALYQLSVGKILCAQQWYSAGVDRICQTPLWMLNKVHVATVQDYFMLFASDIT